MCSMASTCWSKPASRVPGLSRSVTLGVVRTLAYEWTQNHRRTLHGRRRAHPARSQLTPELCSRPSSSHVDLTLMPGAPVKTGGLAGAAQRSLPCSPGGSRFDPVAPLQFLKGRRTKSLVEAVGHGDDVAAHG